MCIGEWRAASPFFVPVLDDGDSFFSSRPVGSLYRAISKCVPIFLARFAYFFRPRDRAKKRGTPFEIAVYKLPTGRDEKKKKITIIQHSYKKNKMLPTIHQCTQVDDCYEYPAVLVLVPTSGDSYSIFSFAIRAGQSRAGQSRVEQSRAEQSRAEQSRAEQSQPCCSGRCPSEPNLFLFDGSPPLRG